MRAFIVLLLAACVYAKECGVGAGGCTSKGSDYCCSYWGYCGTDAAFCGTGTTQCACDCKGSKSCSSTTPAPTTPAPTAPAATCTKYVTTGKVNNRTGPGTSYSSKKVFAKGKEVCVVEIDGDWAKLSDGTYVSKKYIALPNNNSNNNSNNNNSNTNTGGWTGTKRTGPSFKKDWKGTCLGPNTTKVKQTKFIAKILLASQRQEWEHRILTSITLAQAILESGWGKSPICNNIFGVKSYKKDEPRCSSPTHEFVNGKTIKTVCYFKKYETIYDSITDHSRVLLLSRYKKAIGQRDYKIFATEIKKGGYATSTGYHNSLISLIEQYGLWQYDFCCDYTKNPNCV